MSCPYDVDKEPCPTCPYRRDTPVGIWHAEEYHKLATYDEPDYMELRERFLAGEPVVQPDPPLSLFLCHHSTMGRSETLLCRGWLTVARESIAVRIGLMQGKISLEQADAPVRAALYGSGSEARDAGLAGIENPPEATLAAIERLGRAKARHGT